MISGGIVESVGGHQAGNAGEAIGSLAMHAAPVAEPAEGPLDEALMISLLLDRVVAHDVEAALLLAALDLESAVEEGQTQAEPHLLAVIEGRQRFATLHVRRHDGKH